MAIAKNGKKNTAPGILSPWETYDGMLKAVFQRDPEVVVHEVDEANNGAEKDIVISVKNPIKAFALGRLLKQEVDCGNIKIVVKIEDVSDQREFWADLCKAAFDGNDRFTSIEEHVNPVGIKQVFPLMDATLIQFYNDDISDYYNNFNGVPSKVAKEIFVEDENLLFSMEQIRED